jgi:hypothetical protein
MLTETRVHSHAKAKLPAISALAPLASGLLQHKCACSSDKDRPATGWPSKDGHSSLQRKALATQTDKVTVPPIVYEVLNSSGQPLAESVRAFMEPRFGHDFSRVRVHADPLAAHSSQAIDALAYTAGNHIVFGEGQYSPNSTSGRKLLAHELTHVTQNPVPSTSGQLLVGDQPHLEAEADSIANSIYSVAPAQGQVSRTSYTGVQRQKTTPPQKPKTNADLMEEARASAYVRVQRALQSVRGVAATVPKTNPNDQDLAAIEARLESTRLAQVLFKWDNPNMSQVEEILGKMTSALRPGASIVEAKASDPKCVDWTAYTTVGTPPITFCPKLAARSLEERIENLVHESAHAAGIGQLKGEGYCFTFDCNSVCGNGFATADAWAHYVHCLSGQAPQAGTTGNPNPTPGATTSKPAPKGTKP